MNETLTRVGDLKAGDEVRDIFSARTLTITTIVHHEDGETEMIVESLLGVSSHVLSSDELLWKKN